MEVWFSRLDQRRHRFVVARPGLEPIDEALETRSLLLHDLAHYAFESAAEIATGFYGLLASGLPLQALREPDGLAADQLDALMSIERNVARLQSAFKHGAVSCSAGHAAILRSLWGAWSKVKRGEALYLRWPEPAPTVVTCPPSWP